jgi:hypothetical protein
LEIEYARAHGWAALQDRTRAAANRGGPSSEIGRVGQEPPGDGESLESTSSSRDSKQASDGGPANVNDDVTSSGLQ